MTMKPTPTPEMIEAAKKAFVKYSVLMPVDAAISDALSAALSVPAAAVVGEMSERLRDLADQRHMDRGLDAVDDALREAASRISQQDAELERVRREVEEAKEFRAILEGHLSAAIDDYNEARKAAFIEAAEIAENMTLAFEGNEECLEVNRNIRKVAKEIRHRAEEMKG